MTDRDESRPRPIAPSGDRSIERTEVVASDGGLSARDALIAECLRRDQLVDAKDLAEAEAELSGRDDIGLLDFLVDRGHITTRVKSSIGDLITELLERGQTVGQPTSFLSERRSFSLHPRDSEPLQHSIGDYEILNEIARGGMGVVYKARHVKLNRTVALKMIRAGELANDKQVARFYKEAEAAAKLDHPGIVPVYEVGELAGEHYYSMAYVEGESLDARMKRDGPMQPKLAAEIIRDAAQAVQHAHDARVVHRDIKPANILLDPSGHSRVTDFGLAKLQQTDTEMTATGQVLGTPAYMPPEQAAGRMDDVGIAADVYSLGATLYCLLSGRPPFQTANVADTLRQVVESEPIAPRKLDPSIPRDLETICLKCLQKEVSARYGTARDLADDLERWIDGRPIVARRVGRVEKAWKWCKRKPVVACLAVSIAFVLIAGGAFFWERQNASRADGLVDSLTRAEPDQVPGILDELDGLGFWADPRLRRVLADEQPSRAAERARMHARMALADQDESLVDSLIKDLLDAEFADVANLRDALDRSGQPVAPKLWAVFLDETQAESRRFRTGLALAGLVPRAEQWTESDYQFLIDQLVTTYPAYHPALWKLLDPLHESLLPALETAFSDPSRDDDALLTAANTVALFAPEDAQLLARLMLKANGPQYRQLYDNYEVVADSATRETFEQLVRAQPTDEMTAAERVDLGTRRAGAAITLLRLGERESIFDVMRYDSDPEAMTQFIHRCRDRGVSAAELLECLDIVDERRGPLDGDRRKVDDSVLYALLLALGDYSLAEVGESSQPLIDRLVKIYTQDPSSGIHGATGWLLRQWGHKEEVVRVDQQALPYDESGHREWYVEEVDCQSDGADGDLNRPLGQTEKIYFTMVVFPPGEFETFSPETEPGYWPGEGLQIARLEYPIAVCDRELTWRQLVVKEGNWRFDAWSEQFAKTLTLDEPAFGFSWFDGIDYSLWLTRQSGRPAAQQCYTIPDDPWQGEWPMAVDRTGFRHPTEREWEYVCRGGTATAYSFGHDETWLEKYAWYQKNSDNWSHPVAELRPNPRGLFDNHGNLFEWCYDWYGDNYVDSPTGPSAGSFRIYRGGGWGISARVCRSSFRGRFSPESRHRSIGFRLFTVPPIPGQHD